MEDIGVRMVNINAMTIFLLLIVCYIFLYFSGRRYLENFQGTNRSGQSSFINVGKI
jgi:hypothetical protein